MTFLVPMNGLSYEVGSTVAQSLADQTLSGLVSLLAHDKFGDGQLNLHLIPLISTIS